MCVSIRAESERKEQEEGEEMISKTSQWRSMGWIGRRFFSTKGAKGDLRSSPSSSLSSSSVRGGVVSVGGETPLAAKCLGFAGALPFVGGAVGIWRSNYREECLVVEKTYGCAILSFLGAVHWGLALRSRCEHFFENAQ